MKLEDKAAIRTQVKEILRKKYIEIKNTDCRCREALTITGLGGDLEYAEDVIGGIERCLTNWNKVREIKYDGIGSVEDTINCLIALSNWVEIDGEHLINLWNIQKGTYKKQTWQEAIDQI